MRLFNGFLMELKQVQHWNKKHNNQEQKWHINSFCSSHNFPIVCRHDNETVWESEFHKNKGNKGKKRKWQKNPLAVTSLSKRSINRQQYKHEEYIQEEWKWFFDDDKLVFTIAAYYSLSGDNSHIVDFLVITTNWAVIHKLPHNGY